MPGEILIRMSLGTLLPRKAMYWAAGLLSLALKTFPSNLGACCNRRTAARVGISHNSWFSNHNTCGYDLPAIFEAFRGDG
jgi:hypothetical protein